MRHAPFVIGPLQRDAWLRCMRIAVDEARLPEQYRAQLWQYLEMAANSMLNSFV
jgi:hemoglobin